MFVYRTATTCLILLVYVDDILLTGSDSQFMSKFIDTLKLEFAMTDMGPLHYFLGIEVTRSSNNMFLHQRRYATELLSKANMSQCKPVSTPIYGSKLSSSDGELLANETEYRSLLGGLQYLTLTRPDISYAVNSLCQFMHKPTTTHLQAVKRVLRYVAGTLDHGLHIAPSKSSDLLVFSDSDWAGCPDTRRSTTGAAFFYSGVLVSWLSRKQHTVSRSSTESEYRALASSVAELSWLCNVLREIGIPLQKPPIVFCDNVSTIYLTANPIYHARTKHLEIDFHFVRERVASGAIQVRYVPTALQVADVLTKSLPVHQFEHLRGKLHVISPGSA